MVDDTLKPFYIPAMETVKRFKLEQRLILTMERGCRSIYTTNDFIDDPRYSEALTL